MRIRSRLLALAAALAAFSTASISRSDTVALWLFDEQENVYPSSPLNDCGPNSYFLILGRGGHIVPGKHGHALRAITPLPFNPVILQRKSATMIRDGLIPPPKKPGRTVEPLTWFNATFAATFLNGDEHLRREPFANATGAKLNLPAADWTFEFWFNPDAPATPAATAPDGVLFEIGSGPRGENDTVTRLVHRPSANSFIWQNNTTFIELKTSALASAASVSGKWIHCAFVRDHAARELRLYIDGRLQSRAPAAQWAALPHGDEAYVSLCRDGLWQRPLAGAIDELRVSDTALYSADFTPPASFSKIDGASYKSPALKAGPPLLFPQNKLPATAKTIDLGTRRHLFIDDILVDTRENITLQPHGARIAECVVDGGSGWISVVDGDDGVIRLYTTGPKDVPLLYTSRDGVRFDAPDLGLVPDPKYKNILMRDPATVGCVILDPNAPPAERYKIVSGLRKRGGLFVYTSPDGIRFTRNETASLPFWTGSAVTLFYDDQRQLYVIHNRTDYYRSSGGGVSATNEHEFGTLRKQVLTELTDLMRPWPFTAITPEKTREVARHTLIANREIDPWWLDNGPLAPGGFGLEYPVAYEGDPRIDPPGVDVYNTHAQKYEWAPDTYVAFPLMFYHYLGVNPGTRNALSKPERNRGSGIVETQLAVSRDGLNWTRHPRPVYAAPATIDGYKIIRPYVGHGMVRRGNELWQYSYTMGTYHDAWATVKPPPRINRLVIRVDGFVSLDAPYAGGRFTTKPLRFEGNRLVVNIDTGATGHAQIGFIDAATGAPIPGYGVDDCVYINGNEIDYPVEWLAKGHDVGPLAGRDIRLVVRMRGASLYAFQFKHGQKQGSPD